jgi:hypothetical protein
VRNASIINERGEIVAVGYFPDGHHIPVLPAPCENESNAADGNCQNVGSPLLAKISAGERVQAVSEDVAVDSAHNGRSASQGKRLFGSAV